METFSHNSLNPASKNHINSQVFLDTCVTIPHNPLNTIQKRDLMSELACKLLGFQRSGTAYMVFHFLMRKEDYRGISWYSVKKIAQSINKSERTVKRVTKLLHDLKIIKKTRRGEMKSNLYQINYDLIKPSCEPSISYEGTLCVTQNITEVYYNSNCSNLKVKEMNEAIKKDEKPTDIINTDTFYPSGRALDFLNKEIKLENIDIYIKELRSQLEIEERKKGARLLRHEANYKTFQIVKTTKELRLKHQEHYIPVEKRNSYNSKIKEKPKIEFKTYHTEPNIPNLYAYKNREIYDPNDPKEQEIQRLLKQFI